MGRFALASVAVAAVFAGSAALFFVAHTQPSTAELDSDLAVIRSKVQAAETEASRYEGGVIKNFVELRREIDRISEAMLVQKRSSLLRRVDLRFSVNGSPLSPATGERLAEITTDISRAKSKLAEDEENAGKYSGGLLQVTALMTAAADRLTLAQLDLAYYSAKYGFALPIDFARAAGAQQPAKPPGSVTKDKDAL